MQSDAFFDDALSNADAIAASILYRATEANGQLTLHRVGPDESTEGALEDHELIALVLERLDAGQRLFLPDR